MKELKLAIIGAGNQAKAVLDYFIRFSGATEIGILDKDPEPIGKLLKEINDVGLNFRNISTATHSLKTQEFIDWLSKYDAAISCAPYFLNEKLTELAITAGTHLTDLGGNNEIVKAQLKLSEKAKNENVLIVPDLGLAPGMVGLLGADLIRSLDAPASSKELKMTVGGLPVHPEPPLNYNLSFSIHGLINEYLEDCEIIQGGKKKTVPGLSDLEENYFFSHEFDNLECFYTSGGTSTLPDTLLGEVSELNYKTIRYSGHCNQIKLLQSLGFFEPNIIEDSKKKLEQLIKKPFDDMILMKIVASGVIDGRYIETQERLVDYGDKSRGISAMAKCTGYPAAIITSMIGRGEISARGVVPQENCVDVDSFRHFLLGCGINIKKNNINYPYRCCFIKTIKL